MWDAPSAPLAGRAYAVDGDTLGIGETRIRIVGIDAPELDQSCTSAEGDAWPCGREARSFLAALIARSEISCLPEGRDRYGRTLARCSIGDRDLAGEIVGAGWALAEAGYAGDQTAARNARTGIWSGSFEAPSQWRRDRGEQDSTLWDWIRSWFG